MALHDDGICASRRTRRARCIGCVDRQRTVAGTRNLKVVVLGGDGSTYDMALSSTSGAVTRKLDFYYFCYDNEAYGNTGMKLSPATPYGVRTTTSPAADRTPTGTAQDKKDLFEIRRAHRPPYIASSVAPRYPVGSGRIISAGRSPPGAEALHRACPLPHGLALQPRRDPRVRTPGGRDRDVCPQGGDGRGRHPYLFPNLGARSTPTSSCRAGTGICSNQPGRTRPFDTFKSGSMCIGSRSTDNYRVWR